MPPNPLRPLLPTLSPPLRSHPYSRGTVLWAHVLGDDLSEPLNGAQAYWHGELDCWTRSSWSNVCERARERRTLRLEGYDEARERARMELFRGLRAWMRAERGPVA